MKKLGHIPVYITIREENSYFSRLIFVLTDFVLLNIAFFLLNYIKRGTFLLPSGYFTLLLFFYIFWLLIFFLMGKIQTQTLPFKSMLYQIFKSVVALLYSISFLIIFLGYTSYSRMHIIGTCLLLLVWEFLLYSIMHIAGSEVDVLSVPLHRKDSDSQKLKISIFLFIGDFLLLTFSFFMLNLIKTGTFSLTVEYEKILLLFYGIWLVASAVTRKFDIHNYRNYYFAQAAGLKAVAFMGLMLSLCIFAFRLFSYSRLHIFGTLLLFGFIEALMYYFYYVLKFGGDVNGDIESVEGLKDFVEQKELPLEGTQQNLSLPGYISFMKLLYDRYLKQNPRVFEFVDNSIDLSGIDDREIAIINSPDLFNVQVFREESIRSLINLHKVNDVRWINRYFLEVHNRLINGGYLIGRVDTIRTHKMRFFERFPRQYAAVLYRLHFVLFRVFPKLPRVRKIYFAITKGKNRMISRAEILGRLCFSGYRIVSEEEIGGNLFFIAQKVKTPSYDTNPSYGPVIKLKRSGVNGSMIEVLKFRTMYPYSEYLQEYIYNQQKLCEGGKIMQDFRVTDWGKLMRKYWLDELPMLYNWVRGDIKLFGVRPLSRHYLNLYDVYVQKIRKKVKPGLIPPYYADMPKRFEDINDSEKRYIQSYLEHPFKTQVTYFSKAVSNIIFKGARSS